MPASALSLSLVSVCHNRDFFGFILLPLLKKRKKKEEETKKQREEQINAAFYCVYSISN